MSYPNGQTEFFQSAYAIRNIQGAKKGSTTQQQSFGDNFAQYENQHYHVMYQYLSNMLITLFKYKNLPKTLNPYHLENLLRFMGIGVAVGLNKNEDLCVLGTTNALTNNVYGDLVADQGGITWGVPTEFIPDWQPKRITELDYNGNYVLFTNKITMLPQVMSDKMLVEMISSDIANVRASMRMNTIQMRAPYIFKSIKGNNTAKNIMQKVQSGQLSLEVDSSFRMEDLSVMNLNVPNYLPDLREQLNYDFGQFLTQIGIANLGVDKKERLLKNEVNANASLIEASGNVYYEARKHAIDMLNLAFDYNIEVEWNLESMKQLVLLQQQISDGVDNPDISGGTADSSVQGAYSALS